MKLSTRGRYGTKALLDVALNGGEKPVLLKDIAQRQQISLMYLGHLITPLVTAGIIRSTRGAKGGISLARPPQEIRLSEVVQLIEGSIAPVECINNHESCPQYEVCATRDTWDEIKKAVNGVLESTSLQDLVERHEQKQQTKKAMYYI